MSMRRGCYGAMLVAVLATGACTGVKDDPTPTIPTQSTSTATASRSQTDTVTSTPTATRTSVSPADQDEAHATDTLRAYRDALGAASRGEESIEAIYPWAIGTAREQWATQYLLYREQGWTITGETTLEVIDINVEGDQASILACSNVSQV